MGLFCGLKLLGYEALKLLIALKVILELKLLKPLKNGLI